MQGPWFPVIWNLPSFALLTVVTREYKGIYSLIVPVQCILLFPTNPSKMEELVCGLGALPFW